MDIPNIETLDILTINCNTIDMHTSRKQFSRKQTDQCHSKNKILDVEVQMQSNPNTIGIISDNINPMVINNNNIKINYFHSGPGQEAHWRASAKITQQLQKEFKDVFTWIGCFGGTFSLQLKAASKPYQAELRHMAYALQKPFKEGLEQLQ